jgi:hypothetical protein
LLSSRFHEKPVPFLSFPAEELLHSSRCFGGTIAARGHLVGLYDDGALNPEETYRVEVVFSMFDPITMSIIKLEIVYKATEI